jgi:hypothetical protein
VAVQGYTSVLRCQTWNVWPAEAEIDHKPFSIKYGDSETLPARLVVYSYVPQSPLEQQSDEETKTGFTVWTGKALGPHSIWDGLLAPPDDKFEIKVKHRRAYRGEVDICINFAFEGELPDALVEAIRTYSYSIISLLNIQLKDYLIPAAPVQIISALADGRTQFATKFNVHCEAWKALEVDTIRADLANCAGTLLSSSYGDKLRVALELYAAHFTEQQARVRFLLLVIAMEALAPSTEKHQVALDLLGRWKQELETEKANYPPLSEEFKSLDALSRELNFRAEDSIRSQIRKLFTSLPEFGDAELADLQRRALKVYDKRSKLVHDGHLPVGELSGLEKEARQLLETLFASAVDWRRDN